MKKTLFHGSDCEVREPQATAGRRNLDFGRGFYLTALRAQAEAWAQVIASRRGRRSKAVVNEYTYDPELAADFRFKTFETYDREWLEYVIDCRKGGTMQQQFDIVEGGVANDNVIDTVEDYEKGIITAEQALGQLRYKQVNHQICFLCQEAIDKCLRFVQSEESENEDTR